MPSLLRKFDYFVVNLSFNILLVIVLAFVLSADFLKPGFIPTKIFEVVSLIALIPVVTGTIKGLREKEVGTDLLAAVALVFAYLAAEWYSASFINLMLASARIFDNWTQRRSKNLIEGLLKYRPQKAKIQKGDVYEIKPVEKIQIGDIVIIEEGERIPIDGKVVSGQASVDESTLTGESLPNTKKIGDMVYSSTLSMSGSILVKTTKTSEESTLAKIILLVEESSLKKSKTLKFANKFAAFYVVLTLFGSAVIYAATHNIMFVLSILLVVCADDIAVSVPLTFTAAIARAAKYGILIRSSDVLEKISKIKIFVTDKTGTLTLGKPEITGSKMFSNIPERKFLEILGAAESLSTHPLAQPILKYVDQKKILYKEPQKFKEFPGEGVEITYNKQKYFAGKVEFLLEKGIRLSKEDLSQVEKVREGGQSLTALGSGPKMIGMVTFRDQLKPSAKESIKLTRSLGVKEWIMLTGDNRLVAHQIADSAGIDKFECELKPNDKPKIIERLKIKNKNQIVGMIGDGVNDAAALAIADVSFAMGIVGSDTAINASDVTLMNDNLLKVPQAMLLGKNTSQIVFQNFIIWGATNALGLGLVFAGLIGPAGAATYNFLTDFLPIFNALRVSVKRS